MPYRSLIHSHRLPRATLLLACIFWVHAFSLQQLPWQQAPDSASSVPKHIRIAQHFVGHKEIAPNRSPLIDYWNRRVGVPLGSPYCAAFVSFVLDSARAVKPSIRSAYSLDFANAKYGKVIPSRFVLERRYKLEPSNRYIAIWKRRGGGHIGFVEKWYNNKSGQTIEANTSSGSGSQWNGDGVYRRYRNIEPYNTFALVYFTRIDYDTQAKQ